MNTAQQTAKPMARTGADAAAWAAENCPALTTFTTDTDWIEVAERSQHRGRNFVRAVRMLKERGIVADPAQRRPGD